MLAISKRLIIVSPLSKSTVGALEAIGFNKIRKFGSFPCFLDIIQICFKIFIIISLFTVRKGRK